MFFHKEVFGGRPGLWSIRSFTITDISPSGPVPYVAMESCVLDEFIIQDEVRKVFPDYDFVNGFMGCSFRITAFTRESLTDDEHFINVTEAFVSV